MNQSNNPLAGHFRTPALYLELPSRGEHYPPGVLTLKEGSAEVSVYPMTAKDEIALNTPDALLSGTATAQVIESCIPEISDGFAVPTIDIDPLLIAIRIASSGEKMDFTNLCPKCNEENKYEVDLRKVLDQYSYIDFSEPLDNDGLKIFFKPQQFRQLNKVGLKTFQEQRALGILDNESLTDEDKLAEFHKYLKTISAFSVDISAGFISKIVTENGQEVIEREFILEYLNNCPKNIYKKIEEKIVSYGEYTKTKPMKVICQHCQHQYETAIEYEASNFFG